MSISTILFDLDGTLVDTAPDLGFALNTVLLEHNLGKKSLVEIRPLVSKGGRALIKFGFGIDEDATGFDEKHQRLLAIYTENIARNSRVFQGIDEVLASIKTHNLFWGIVTNKPTNLTHLLLDNLALKPDVIVCGDTLAYNKPSPEPLFFACSELKVLPINCIFVGDDEVDILAGKNAKIKTVAANYGYGEVRQNLGYDYLIEKPQDLLEIIYA